jgi:hypothetical protein
MREAGFGQGQLSTVLFQAQSLSQHHPSLGEWQGLGVEQGGLHVDREGSVQIAVRAEAVLSQITFTLSCGFFQSYRIKAGKVL